MISEVDDQLGRLWAALQASGAWDDTFIVVTADHAEQLGDHGLIQKLGYFEESHHIVGIVRDPRHPEVHGTVLDRFTENVDVFPTLCDAMGIDVPAQVDGLPLTPFLAGDEPPWWRDAAHWEYDWRGMLIGDEAAPWPWDRRLERQHLAVLRNDTHAYVQFGNGDWFCFDLADRPDLAHDDRGPCGCPPADAGHAHLAQPAHRAHPHRHARRAGRHRTLAAAGARRWGQSFPSQHSAAVIMASMPALRVGSWTGAK